MEHKVLFLFFVSVTSDEGKFLFLLQVGSISGGPFTYALCQTGCNLGVVACFAAAGQFHWLDYKLREKQMVVVVDCQS
jgi:hypothetical protein